MKRFKHSTAFKALLGYLLLAAFAGGTVWFIYNKVVELNKPNETELNDQKMTLFSDAATRLYTTDGISRDIIRNKDTTRLVEFHGSVDTVSVILDSLKTLYPDEKNTQNELDSIGALLQLKKNNLHDLLEFREQYTKESYHDRVMSRIEEKGYILDSIDYKNMVENLDPQQQEIVVGYLNYVEQRDANQMNERIADSLIKTVKQVLLSLEFKEHRFQQNVIDRENKLLNNDLKISNRLQNIRNKIEQEELQKSLARVESVQKTQNQTSTIMIVFGVACTVTILVFVIMILRDINRSRRYRKALEKAKRFSEQLLKSREQIMATVTHDLRSPLNSISGYSDLMGKTDLNSKQKNYLKQLKKSSDFTIQLVNDLLDLSRLETGKIRIEKLPFIPEHIIEDTVETVIPKPDPKKLNIQISLDDEFRKTFLGDSFRLRQVLSNLLGNAYKFTKRGKIELTGEIVHEKEKLFLIIGVEDSGIGMTKEQQEHIFEEFSQAETSTEKQYGGSGLGLAISRKMAGLLDGSIKVESEPDKGSKFTLKIPVELAKQTTVNDKKEQGISQLKNVDNLHVLLVDDDQIQLDLLKEVLSNQGFSITTAKNGKVAWRKIKNHNYDAVYTDIQMPELDGFGLVKKIRAKGSLKDLPVLALSGQSDKPKSAYINKGFTDYILKPFEVNKLLKSTAKMLPIEMEKRHEKKALVSSESTLYNLQELNIFTGGDEDSLKAVLKSFIEETDHNIKKLKKTKEHQDRKKAAFIAHKMLPMLRQMKASDSILWLERIERYKSKSLTSEEFEQSLEWSIKHTQKLLKVLKKEVAT